MNITKGIINWEARAERMRRKRERNVQVLVAIIYGTLGLLAATLIALLVVTHRVNKDLAEAEAFEAAQNVALVHISGGVR